MKRTAYLIMLLGCMVLASCGGFYYSDETTIAGGVWNSFEPRRFDFEWKKPELCVDLSLKVAVDTSVYHEPNLPVIVKISGPEGESRQFRTQINILDREGKLMGEVNEEGMAVCDETVRPHMFFNTKGTQQIEITQGTSKYNLCGIHKIGIELKKSKLKYK